MSSQLILNLFWDDATLENQGNKNTHLNCAFFFSEGSYIDVVIHQDLAFLLPAPSSQGRH
jgi:hypothetical protein